MDYLNEIRRRLICYLVLLFGASAFFYYLSQTSYDWLARPLLRYLPDSPLIAISMTAPFVISLKLSLFLGIITTLPYLLFHIVAFISPALYPNEKRTLWPLVSTSVILFYSGMVFAYSVVLPCVIQFCIAATPMSVHLHPDIGHYFKLCLSLLLAFGIAFQTPIVIVMLTRLNIVSTQALAESRRYIIVLAFVLGMLMTPPDVVSQIMLALPLWGLFEIGLGVSRFLETRLCAHKTRKCEIEKIRETHET